MGKRRSVTATLAVLAAVLTVGRAHGAGLYVSDRGVRPLGRGGAFVAGADDLGAIWYNPAGIVDAPSSFLGDLSWIDYQTTFARQALVTTAAPTSTTLVQRFPAVTGTTPFLPIPTAAGSIRFGSRNQYAVALGVYAPDAALLKYPDQVAGQPAPQRYSLISLDGSLLAVIGAWFAYKPTEALRLGAGIQMLTGSLKTTIDFSACPPDNLLCASEDPDYQAFSALRVGPIFAPSANLGATWVPLRALHVGVSGQAPFVIDAPATVDVRLPTAVEFDSAYQQGRKAHFHMDLPPVVRVGVEVRPLSGSDDLRIEVAYVREFWSIQKSIDVTPEDIGLYQILGFPSPYRVPGISLPRQFRDSDSVRLGAEYGYDLLGLHFLTRAGVSYETSAVPEPYVSAFTVDSAKVPVSIGGSLVIGTHLRLDAVFSHTFASDVTVRPEEAALYPVNPVNGNPTRKVAVNGGTYGQNLNVVGVGMEYRF
ncbi:MAG TPA: outer membrane protein transport protein [Polyangiaceae bacterium]|nr:outer membrane protein transport protein [Polyangiaceae bacterium]